MGTLCHAYFILICRLNIDHLSRTHPSSSLHALDAPAAKQSFSSVCAAVQPDEGVYPAPCRRRAAIIASAMSSRDAACVLQGAV